MKYSWTLQVQCISITRFQRGGYQQEGRFETPRYEELRIDLWNLGSYLEELLADRRSDSGSDPLLGNVSKKEIKAVTAAKSYKLTFLSWRWGSKGKNLLSCPDWFWPSPNLAPAERDCLGGRFRIGPSNWLLPVFPNWGWIVVSG